MQLALGVLEVEVVLELESVLVLLTCQYQYERRAWTHIKLTLIRRSK